MYTYIHICQKRRIIPFLWRTMLFRRLKYEQTQRTCKPSNPCWRTLHTNIMAPANTVHQESLRSREHGIYTRTSIFFKKNGKKIYIIIYTLTCIRSCVWELWSITLGKEANNQWCHNDESAYIPNNICRNSNNEVRSAKQIHFLAYLPNDCDVRRYTARASFLLLESSTPIQ